MRYVGAALGFATGGLASVAVAMALLVHAEGYTYRGTPVLGNVIMGVMVLGPYVLCGSLGFALGLRLFGAAAHAVRSLLIGAGFVLAVGLLIWALHRLFRFNPFEYSMVGGGILMFAAAIPAALVRCRRSAPATRGAATIVDYYGRAVGQSIGLQIVLVLYTLIWLSGSMTRFGVAELLYWALAAAVMWRRPYEPTRVDLEVVRAGFLICYLVVEMLWEGFVEGIGTLQGTLHL